MSPQNSAALPATAATLAPLALVVDDDVNVRRPIVELLKLHGMRVIESCNADEALGIVQASLPNLVFVDIMMRGKPEGFDLCWKIKTNPATSECYVIMLTGLGDQGDVEIGREHGADQYLVKPVSMTLLWEIVAKLGVIIRPADAAGHSDA